MSVSEQDLFPLATVTRENLARLCSALWGWSPCRHWVVGEQCPQAPSCSCQRAIKLEPFFDYYRNVTAYYLPDSVGHSYPALKSHDNLIDIITLLKDNVNRHRSELTAEYFAPQVKQVDHQPPSSDQNRAFNLAARIISMVQASAENLSDGLLEAGIQPAIWHSDRSFINFIDLVFRKKEHPALNSGGDVAALTTNKLALIAAKRLKKVARLKIIPTNDLSNHLLLDEKHGTVAIFHYTSVLKEHLRAGATDADKESQGSRWNIPPQLALETLATLKEVLFPDDSMSLSILRTLIVKYKLDPDIISVIDLPLYRSAVKRQIDYQYWGSRLMDLYDELENPTPRGFFEKWLERRSGARYVMMATLTGVVIAIILGMFGLAVSIFQAWVGWQQWKHPITSG